MKQETKYFWINWLVMIIFVSTISIFLFLDRFTLLWWLFLTFNSFASFYFIHFSTKGLSEN